jgi:superfamily I DNA/RNA helicase
MAANQSESQIGVLTDKISVQKTIFNQLSAKKAADREFKDVKIQYYDSYEYNARDKRAGRGNRPPTLETDINWQDPGIKLLNFMSAKGLEFDAVFMPELQDLQSIHSDPKDLAARLFYVAVTRARLQLILSYSGSGEPAIMSLFPEEYLTLMGPS